MSNRVFNSSVAAFALTIVLGGCVAHQSSGGTVNNATDRGLPGLVVTNDTVPDVLYMPNSRDITVAERLSGDGSRFMPRIDTTSVETLVTRKVRELSSEHAKLSGATGKFSDRLLGLQMRNDVLASDYYVIVAAISAELQSGTTAGNPVLTEQRNRAQRKLDALAQGAGSLNELATDMANEASKGNYLQESVRAAYALSGAVKEDHKKLRTLEDGVNHEIVKTNRLLTSVNDEINRRTAYLRSESLNMQTLSLAIANGEMYGQSMTNSLFKKAAAEGGKVFAGQSPASRHPLVVIRFDRSNVSYKQAVYTAISQALAKYPAASFDLVAVSASEGNPAQRALASTEARKNGEDVLRSLTQMGLPVERVSLNAATSRDVLNSEVHLYIQ